MINEKTAVVLFNLGGPDSIKSVTPFLRNLFSDPAIIRAPFFVRWFLSRFISRIRAKTAKEIYSQIGGKSPILSETEKQAEALNVILGKDKYKVFVSMRYWTPQSKQVLKKIIEWNPDKTILLPLYPHLSTTTTSSSFDDWEKNSSKLGFDCPTKKVCCFPLDEAFILSHIELIQESINKVHHKDNFIVLFSAHGLPKKVVLDGDPYVWQINETVKKIVQKLNLTSEQWKVAFQSKVTPVEWVKPYTEDEIINAGKANKSVIIVPISFVSEHSETLVELDIEYKNIAVKSGVDLYERVPALGVSRLFIEGLSKIVFNVNADKAHCENFTIEKRTRICPANFYKCRFENEI